MSYASVASQNAPPLSQQPKPDPALYVSDPSTATGVADDTAKINIVNPNFKNEPRTLTSETTPLTDEILESRGNRNGSSKRKDRSAKLRAEKELHQAEQEATHIWALTKERILQPGVAGGIIGVVNLGLLSWVSYTFYTNPLIRRDIRAIGSVTASFLALFGIEGYAAERYAQTARGKAERERTREEGAALYRNSREIILRPRVLGGLVGVLNVGMLSGIGYFMYTNWGKPRWDRKIVSAVTVGLLGLWTGEGYLAEKYRENY